jgi:hypothetical protein
MMDFSGISEKGADYSMLRRTNLLKKCLNFKELHHRWKTRPAASAL